MGYGDRSHMILLIQTSQHHLHYYEFVKPIEDILKKEKIAYRLVHYSTISTEMLQNAQKIIICGTSLKDEKFIQDINYFQWIKTIEKPIRGICAGMHILGLIYEGQLQKQKEIGLQYIFFKKEFLGMKKEKQFYVLHKYVINSNQFNIYAVSQSCHQAIKHKTKPFYGVLFHPEVRNKELIIEFIHTS